MRRLLFILIAASRGLLLAIACGFVVKIRLKVPRSSADLQLYDSKFQTEGALMLKAFADNAGGIIPGCNIGRENVNWASADSSPKCCRMHQIKYIKFQKLSRGDNPEPRLLMLCLQTRGVGGTEQGKSGGMGERKGQIGGVGK